MLSRQGRKRMRESGEKERRKCKAEKPRQNLTIAGNIYSMYRERRKVGYRRESVCENIGK